MRFLPGAGRALLAPKDRSLQPNGWESVQSMALFLYLTYLSSTCLNRTKSLSYFVFIFWVFLRTLKTLEIVIKQICFSLSACLWCYCQKEAHSSISVISTSVSQHGHLWGRGAYEKLVAFWISCIPVACLELPVFCIAKQGPV